MYLYNFKKKRFTENYDQLEKIIQKYEGEIRNHIRVNIYFIVI